MAEGLQRYDAEQARLRREHEEGRREDLHIEPPKPPEVNPEILKDVEPLLFRGFIYVSAEINGVNFVFKSLNHHEFERIALLAGDPDNRGQRDFYDYFLAYGVLMIDGVNVLPDRDNWLPEIANSFREFEETARRRIIWHLSEINRRASRAVLLTEVYSLENISRLRWMQYKNLDLTSPAATGFAGTEHIGLNWGQLTWQALNNIEDHRDQSEREWENAKFVASAMAGSKGLSQVNSRDRQRRERELNERIARRDQILRIAILGETPAKGEAQRGAPMKVARTVEELADQLERDLKGEKDWHDQVVEAYEQRARNQYSERLRRLEELRIEHEAQYGDRPVIGGTDSFGGLTSDQVRDRIARRHQTIAAKLAQARQSFPEAFDPKLQTFMDKWTNRQSGATELREVAPRVVAERPNAVPFKRGRD